MAVIFYFALVDEGVAFSAGAHATTAQKVYDGVNGGEYIFNLEISQSEGDFPTLLIEIPNPGVGLLSAGRKTWCWLSWNNNGAGVVALFNGRLIGIPESLADEVVRLQFVARPADYIEQKEALADSLRVLPYWDPVWLQESVEDADTVLESRALRWHMHRTSLVVSTSNIIAGEAGTIEVDADHHLYDEMGVSYGDAPLRRVQVKGSVEWDQQGAGDVDLTRELVKAFQDAGSFYPYPIIGSMTGEGLFGSWPQPEAGIGAGWSMALTSSIELAGWIQPAAYPVTWVDKSETDDAGNPVETQWQRPTVSLRDLFFRKWQEWSAAFEVNPYLINFVVHYEASRKRSETVTAVLEADVQSLLVDPGAAETETLELSSSLVGEPIDDGDLPVGDLRRNSYFKTDRGAQSFEYLLLLARAKLLARARAVQIKFVTTWDVASAITCRHNVHLEDDRLPGGEATGKVVDYKLSASGEGEIKAEVTIGCTIGYGVALGAAASGTPSYVNTGYVNAGYQQVAGGQSTLIAGELLYESFDNFEVDDDDGLNLLAMTPGHVINEITISGGIEEQKVAIAAVINTTAPDPIGALREVPTVVTLDLRPVAGGDFHVDFDVDLSELVVPQSIDLEAA